MQGLKGAELPDIPGMAQDLEQMLLPVASGPTAEQALEAILHKAAQVAGDPERFTPYEDNPIGFVEDILGITLWEGQKRILTTAIDNPRVACRSGHSVGKTFAVACLVLWWLYARKGLVITTAPTWEHVEGVLWREINSIASKALVPLPGTAYQTERRINNQWYALGLSTNTPSAFQGRHHPRLLVVLDEAPGVSEQVHLEVGVCATGEKNCILMIGNPTTTSGTFYDAFKNPAIWKLQHISCLDHPNVVTKEEVIRGAVTHMWVEEKRGQWGENHPFWASRVLGDFPRISMKGVIPLYLVERQMGNEEKRQEALRLAQFSNMPIIMGVDVARYGDNFCVSVLRQGDAVIAIEEWHHSSTMETAGRVVQLRKQYGVKKVFIDEIGVGGGVVDRLHELNEPIEGFNSGHRAFTPGQFANRRSELWWHLRTRMEHGRLWLPTHNILFGELIAPEYELSSSGRLRVESKETMSKRGIKSPDRADALVMAFANESTADEFLYVDDSGVDESRDMTHFFDTEPEAEFAQLPVGF